MCGGELFKIDLRVQENAVLEDQGRVTNIQGLVDTLRTQHRTESVIADMNKTGEFDTFSEESNKTIQKKWKFRVA